MSNQEGSTPTVESLSAEVERLSALIQAQQGGNATSGNTASGSAAEEVNAQPTSGIGVIRAPGDGAKIIGASADSRGGTVLGYSDGTVTLVGVPADSNGDAAKPFGTAPEGDYVAFYMDDNDNRYNWIAADGKRVASVDNPVQVRS